MSTQISDAHVRQFHDNVTLMFQQKGSKLRGTVRERSCTAAVDFWDRIGKTAAVRKTVRHGDTPQVDTPHSRRACYLEDWEWSDLIDKQDMARILIDPQSAYAQNAAMAMGRALDDAIIACFYADVLTGETGTTTVTFDADWPNGNRASGQGDEDFSGAALTTANISTLKKEMDDNDVPTDGRHIVMPPSGFSQLLAQTTAGTVVSSDYNSIKALVRGEIDTWLGFKFHMSTRMPLAVATEPMAFAWHEDAVGLSINMDMMTRVTERADKSYSNQVYCAMSFNAVRVQGEGVIRFQLDNDN